MRTNQRRESVCRRLLGSHSGVMGEDVSVEDTGYEVLRILGWQEKGVVALAMVRVLEEDREIMDRSRLGGRNQR